MLLTLGTPAAFSSNNR